MEFEPNPALPNVLLLGDSISIGYTLQVRKLLEGKANVYRPLRKTGLPDNCFTAKNGVEHLKDWLGSTKWSVIHFNFGLHDLMYISDTKVEDVKKEGHPELTIPEYTKNLETLLPMLKETGAKLIFATTTTVPEGEKKRIPGDENNYNAAALTVIQRSRCGHRRSARTDRRFSALLVQKRSQCALFR